MTPPPSRPPRPAPGEPREYHFPRFERRALGNGLRVVVAPVRKLPIVSVVVVVDAGAVSDPQGLEGLAQLTAKLLMEGTMRCDGAELTERFERLGASVESAADWDSATVSMTVLTAHLDDAFRLLSEVVLEPAFREREVERLKGERLAELLQLRAEPRGLADETFSRVVYAPASRFARPEGGNDASVARIDRKAIAGFYGDRYGPGATTVIVVGDIDADRATSLVDATLGQWSRPAAARVVPVAEPARSERSMILVPKSDAPQTELRVGHVGVPRRHPDYFSIVVMNAILGGLFNSRINLNLREKHGYTYGAFSGFDWRREAGPFAVSTAVRSDVTSESVREILAEIDRMRSEPPAETEVSLATSYLDGVFPIRYETTAAIAAALGALVVYDLPEDYFDTYRSHIRGVTGAAVQSAARAHLRSDALQILAVGDASTIRGPLEKLGVGELRIEDPGV